MKAIIKIIKAIKPLYFVLFHIRRFIIFIWVRLCNCWSGKHTARSESIYRYKNKHEGERCFIVATGPSLTIQDLEKLKDEYTFSMNSIVNMYTRTSFRPTYYVVQDGIVERKLRKTILASKMNDVFIGVGNVPGFFVNITGRVFKKYYSTCNRFNLDLGYHFYEMYYASERARIKFADECEKKVYDGFTVTYSAIELAVYMGFKEIYILGCDASRGGHVDQGVLEEGKNEPLLMNIKGYEVARKYADKHGIKILNATRGGLLEAFPRVNFDDLF